MKKFLFVLMALLLAAPTMGDVNITCTAVDDEVTVRYDASGETELPRAFALDITVSEGTIDTLVDSNDLFWVHPGNIVIDGNSVTAEGSPIAVQDGNYPDREEGGLGTDGITIEMGSLYDPCDATHTIAPDATGDLLTFTVDTTLDSTVTIAGNAARGEVVLEDASQATVNYSTCEVVVTPAECFPAAHADYAAWAAVGKPTSWCHPKQCHGDATGSDETFGRGNLVSVGSQDVGVLLSGYNTSTTDYSDPVSDPWIAADFTHSTESFGRGNLVYVGSQDVAELLSWYNTNTASVPTDCLDVP